MKLMIKRVMSLTLVLTIVFALTACNVTEYEESNNIIEVSELKNLLSDSKTIVIDTRSEEDYSKGHLKGAINLPTSLLTIADPVNGVIAPQEVVEEVLSSHGISVDSNVYIYDNTGGVYASRVWWVLKVYGHETVKVINGGEEAILLGKLELSADKTTLDTTTYLAKAVDTSMIATIDDVKAVVDGNVEACILDVRSQAEFDEGAIPTAVLYPHTKNLYTDGTFKSARDIGLNYNDLGIKKDEEVILYCKSSFRATQTVILLKEAGYENVRIYDGAWLEWSVKDMPKEEKTEEIVTPSAGDGS